jgi:hypothetical protein
MHVAKYTVFLRREFFKILFRTLMSELWFPHGCRNVDSRPVEYDSVEVGIEVRTFRKSVLLPASGYSRLVDIFRRWRPLSLF